MGIASASTGERPVLGPPSSGASPGAGCRADRCRRKRPATGRRPARRWSDVGRGRDDRGEGVISAAIAVLVMAGLGALMWVGFRTLWEDTEANTRDRVAEIGR